MYAPGGRDFCTDLLRVPEEVGEDIAETFVGGYGGGHGLECVVEALADFIVGQNFGESDAFDADAE